MKSGRGGAVRWWKPGRAAGGNETEEWSNYKYRNYQYTKSQYGGIVVDFDDKLVYTDRNGNPMRTLTVATDDRWLNNDIIEQMLEFEERRVDYETQQRILECLFPKGRAHFDYREYGRGTPRDQRRATVENSNGQVRKGNRTDLSDAETSVYDESRVKNSPSAPRPPPRIQAVFLGSAVDNAGIFDPGKQKGMGSICLPSLF